MSSNGWEELDDDDLVITSPMIVINNEALEHMSR